MLWALSCFAACCYHITGNPSKSELSLSPDVCFAFSNADLTAKKISVALSSAPEGSFFGTDTNEAAKLPKQIIVVDDEVPATGDINYSAFVTAIPILCSPAVKDSDRSRVVLPESVVTEDEYPVVYALKFEENSPYYSEQYEKQGNCINVVRNIPYLDDPGVSSGECVGLTLGLLLGAGLIAGCIIFLAPLLKKGEETEQEPKAEEE
jgi:hypothetical protein